MTKLGPIFLLVLLLLSAAFLGLGGLALMIDWLGNRSGKESLEIGLPMLAFAALCGFAASSGLVIHRKHPRVRQSN
jgi:hypothetical protein